MSSPALLLLESSFVGIEDLRRPFFPEGRANGRLNALPFYHRSNDIKIAVISQMERGFREAHSMGLERL